MIKQIIPLLLLFVGFSINLNAQFGGFSHEVGIITGPIAFQSDYGERYDLSTNAENTGIGIGVIHYLNFSYKADCNCYTSETYFNDHFKLRSELSYNKTELQHFGKYLEGKPSDGKKQLKAMFGNTAISNLGMQLEFFPWSIRDFTATTGGLGPFVSIGGQFSYYDPTVNTTYGDGKLTTEGNFFPKYWEKSEGEDHGFTNKGSTVWSIVSSVGTRYKLAPLSDFMVDLRFQYFFSNWVDGLNPNPERYKENRANDWLVWFNVGYIYYLQ